MYFDPGITGAMRASNGLMSCFVFPVPVTTDWTGAGDRSGGFTGGSLIRKKSIGTTSPIGAGERGRGRWEGGGGDWRGGETGGRSRSRCSACPVGTKSMKFMMRFENLKKKKKRNDSLRPLRGTFLLCFLCGMNRRPCRRGRICSFALFDGLDRNWIRCVFHLQELQANGKSH